MATQAFRLAMRAPLHVGEAGVGLEETLSYLPSDTLFSALVVTWLETQRYASWVDMLDSTFATAPPLLLTSAMPYAGDVRFFPRPMLPTPPREGGKRFKRMRWVSERIFEQLIQNISVADMEALWRAASQELAGPRVRAGLIQDGAVWVTQTERAEIAAALDKPTSGDLTCWSVEQAPRVTIDRISESSNLFHIGRTHFAKNCGLWCVASGEDKWVKAAEYALHLLADSGMGGLRSRGHGAFRIGTEQTWADIPSADGAHQVLLGRLAPTHAQMGYLKAPGASYELVTVGGWANGAGDDPLIRQRLRMLAEGSIVESSDHALGYLADVNPPGDSAGARKTPPPPKVDHPIFRNGYGFGVNLKLNETMLEEE